MNRNNSIISQLREAYGLKESIDRKISVSRFVYRPLSFYLAVPFVRLGFSANGVTLLRFLIAIIGFFLLAVGGYALMVAGSVVLFFSALLDFVDGNIARFRKETSHFGKFLEDVTDTVIKAIIPLAVSIGLYMRADYLLISLNNQVPHGLILIIGATASLVISFQAILSYRLHAALLEVESIKTGIKPTSVNSRSPDYDHPKALQRFANYTVFFLRREAYFMLGGIMLFAIFNIMSVFLLIRWVASFIHFIFECIQTLIRARRGLNIYRPL